MRIQIYGNVHSITGPAMHAREFCKAMGATNNEVSLKSAFPSNPNWIVEKELQALIDMPTFETAPRIVLEDPTTLYHHFQKECAGIFPFPVFEGTCISKTWAEALAQPEVTGIFTCSTHSANTIFEANNQFKDVSIDKNKVHIVPHGYNPIFYHPQGKKRVLGADDGKFTFLYVGGWSQGIRDRKGFDILYKAFVQEFKKEDNVRLVGKLTKIYNQPGYDPVALLNNIQPNTNNATVQLIMEDYPNMDDLASLYRMANVFVMPTKADGFNIPGIEALACGIPVLATDFGGQTDYLQDKNSWLLHKGELDWATDSTKYLYDWSKWKTPDVTEMREQLRYLFENQEEVKKKADVAYDSIKEWTWGRSAQIATDKLKSLGFE